MSTGSPLIESTGTGTAPVAGDAVVSVDELEEHTARLAGAVVEALTPSATGIDLAAGPADAQDGVDDLLPPGTISGVIARLRDCPALQVVLILGEAFASTAPPAEGDSGPELPEPWMAPTAAAMEGWAAGLGGTLINAMPLADAEQLRHLLVAADGTTLMAAGLFGGTALIGSVAVVGRTEPGETAASAGLVTGSDAFASPAPAATPGEPAAPAAAPTAAPTAAPAGAPAGAAAAVTRGGAGAAALEAMHVLAEVEMMVTAELGRTRMSVSELLTLAPGSLIELDRTAGSPIDLLVNGTLIARGEVVVVDEEYGIRLTEITGSES